MSANDFVVTRHAFERMEERFADLIVGLSDVQQAQLMQREVDEALEAGRHSVVPPVELSPRAVERWQMRYPGSFVAWIQDKKRGYLLREDAEEGLIVLTVISGEERAFALKDRLHRLGAKRRRKR